MEKEIKIKANYNINKSILKEFNKLTKERAINKSGLIELIMTTWIENVKKDEAAKQSLFSKINK